MASRRLEQLADAVVTAVRGYVDGKLVRERWQRRTVLAQARAELLSELKRQFLMEVADMRKQIREEVRQAVVTEIERRDMNGERTK